MFFLSYLILSESKTSQLERWKSTAENKNLHWSNQLETVALGLGLKCSSILDMSNPTPRFYWIIYSHQCHLRVYPRPIINSQHTKGQCPYLCSKKYETVSLKYMYFLWCTQVGNSCAYEWVAKRNFKTSGCLRVSYSLL